MKGSPGRLELFICLVFITIELINNQPCATSRAHTFKDGAFGSLEILYIIQVADKYSVIYKKRTHVYKMLAYSKDNYPLI